MLNFVNFKKEYRSCMTHERNSACMSVGMEEHLIDVFPFVKFVRC